MTLKKQHLIIIERSVKEDATRYDCPIEDALDNYLTEIPYTVREIEMICDHMGFPADEYTKHSASASDVNEFINSLDNGL